MSVRFPEAGLAFLRELAANNNKEWFDANRKRYEHDLRDPARAVVAALTDEITEISPRHAGDPKRAISRINRDIRFSKDKTPYNTTVWAGWHPGDAPKGSGAGFYFGFSPDELGVGCGVWSPGKPQLESLRAHIAASYDEWQRMTAGGDYEIGSKEQLKRVPAPWPADHPAAELLKMKGVHLKRVLPASLITSDALVPTLAGEFRRLAPVVAWLNRGLGV